MKSTPPSYRWALASLSVPVLMASLDTSIANTALPTLARAFAASFPAVQWVVLAYLLALTSLLVGAGRFGDLVGRRRLLLAGIGLFTAASLACGVAPVLWLLVAARVVQGLGAAVMLALTLAVVGETVPKEHTGRTMGLLGTMSAIGTALGPALGGLLVTGLGWRSLFLVNLPVGLLAMVLAHRYLPADRPRLESEPAGFDFPGTLLLAATLVAYALAVTVGGGRFVPATAALLLAALAGAGLFAFVESSAESPLVHLAMFRDRGLGASLATSALVATVMMSTLVVGPFYLAHALGLEPSLVGLVVSIGPLVVGLAGVPAGRLADRLGARRTTSAGLAGMAAGTLLLFALPGALGLVGYIPSIVLLTASYALVQASNNAAVMSGSRSEQRGVVSGMLSLARNLGLITGASVMGSVFTLAAGTGDLSGARPEAVATGMRTTFAVATGLMVVALAITHRIPAPGEARGGRATVPEVPVDTISDT